MVVQRLAVLSILATSAWAQCERSVDLDFVVLADEASHRAIEDDIRADLALVGVNAVPRYLEKEEFNAAMVAGDYDLVFSETWGAPYDPHSYVASWTTPDEAHYPVLETLEPPMDPESFDVLVDDVLSEVDLAERQSKWTDILTEIHADVIHLPLWGKRIPSVVSKVRVEDYLPGEQQFEYRVDRIRVIDGSKNISVSPGAQTGLFQSVGPMEPHGYRPNEFFSNNWLYESLVSYGPNGNIEPALASSWSSSVNDDGSETFRFAIRQGVTFHDGAEFNCSVVELNFDHVSLDLFIFS